MDEAREANPGCPEYDDDHAQVLLAYDKHFLDMAMNPDVLNIVRRFVGEYFIVRWQTGIINRPNIQDDATAWHRDLVHQHYISTPPLSISALYCLDDFSPETGGTQILTGSHLHEKFPSKEYEEKFTDTVTAPAGSIVVFDAMMFHRAGLNTSSNLRRAVSHVYTVPIFKSPVSIPKMLKDKYKDDPQLREILGYNSEMVDDVSEWRRREYLKDAYSE
jgi:ectoine hydroxylase-related dioxygenase (phytanoyl-CoA dioxygenase family)